jgi:hypothetical protein
MNTREPDRPIPHSSFPVSQAPFCFVAGRMAFPQNPDLRHIPQNTARRAPLSVQMPVRIHFGNWKSLFDNQHFPSLNEAPCSQPINVNTTRQGCGIESDLIVSRGLFLIHQHSYFPAEEIVHIQTDIADDCQLIPDCRHRIEGVGVVCAQLVCGWRGHPSVSIH